jgi:hypothetical protein
MVVSQQMPLSLIVACYIGEDLTEYKHIISPECENGKKLWFLLDRPVSANCVKISYVDRLSVIRPHIVRILID